MGNSEVSVGKPNNKAIFTLYLAMMSVGMGQSVVFAILPMLGRALHLDLLVRIAKCVVSGILTGSRREIQTHRPIDVIRFSYE